MAGEQIAGILRVTTAVAMVVLLSATFATPGMAADPYVPPTAVTPEPPPLTHSPPQDWYYCPSMKGYYPYVADCPEGRSWVVPHSTAP